MNLRLGLVIFASILLSACNEQNDNKNAGAGQVTGRSFSVIGALRPKADPEVMRKIHEEELSNERLRQAELERQASFGQGDPSLDPTQRNLPGVDTSPFASIGNSIMGVVNAGQAQVPAQAGSSAPWSPSPNQAPQAQPNYGVSSYAPPSAGFVPPPPAVSLSTSAQAMPYGAPPGPDPYSNMYANPYMNPFMQQQQSPSPPQRPTGSLFGSGSSSRSAEDSSADEELAKKAKRDRNVTVITPTGMESRSSYKQRDDLRLLWKGVVTANYRDERFSEDLAKINVGLPGEASKGSLSISQRQIDNLFKNGALDKKIIAQVKKSESDLAHAYYRYLYAFNKFSLTQQNLAARKQELELADSQSEKQRAAADLSQSQNDAEASKEDMHSAQNDLASIAGAQSARTVIGRICGVTPSLDSLAQGESNENASERNEDVAGGFFNSVGSAFGLGKPKIKESIAESDTEVSAKAKPEKPKDKGKDHKDKKRNRENTQNMAQESEDFASIKSPPVVESASISKMSPQGTVSFELKDVKTTPRKSILRVSLRNNGGNDFSFDADHVYVAEGNNRLADAAVRAEFDSTLLQPNQEITGTITIFGRPWNDKLTVSLSDGGKAIVMHR